MIQIILFYTLLNLNYDYVDFINKLLVFDIPNMGLV